jgi:hypothetical protein
LENNFFVEDSCGKRVISKLRGNRIYIDGEDDVDLLLSFDPKSCTMPYSLCCCVCEECIYNPLSAMLEPYTEEMENFTFVISRQDIIDTLFDTINLLAKAFKMITLR